MVTSAPPSSGGGVGPNLIGGRKPLNFVKITMKRKQSVIKFFVMRGIFLLSARSHTQKYRIYELTEDIASLEEDQKGISRMNHFKQSLLAEAALQPTGASAARFRLLFGDESN